MNELSGQEDMGAQNALEQVCQMRFQVVQVRGRHFPVLEYHRQLH